MREITTQEVLLPEGPGRRLREARSALRLSRQEVARELRLKPELITALEEDDVASLPAPIYVTGYLKNYARLLRIPSEPLIECYQHFQVEAPGIVSEIVRPHDGYGARRAVRWVSIALFILLLAGFVSWLQKQDFAWLGTTTSQDAVISEQGPAELPAAPAEAVEPAGNSGEPAAIPVEPPVDPTSGVSPSPVTESAIQAPIVAEPEPQPVESAAKQTAAFPDRLVLRTTDDCWAEVTDAQGRRLVYDLLPGGAVRDERGTAPFRVFLGNASAVSMELNGHAYDFSEYVRGNLARFTVLNDKT